MSSKKKKGASADTKPILGRPGNNVKMGIVGLPNVGKSTMFNVLSNLSVPAENYPFCTIDPSLAKVTVPDKRFDHLVDIYKPKSRVSAALTVTDIAGLVKGAHEGKGLGNAFLSNIDAVDAIYHVVRAFRAKTVEHVEGDVDPVRDLEIISNELRFKDLASMKNKMDDFEKAVRGSKEKQPKDELKMAQKFLAHLESGKEIRQGDWTGKEIQLLNTLKFLTAKPVTYLVNVSKKNWEKGSNKWLKPIQEWIKKNAPGDNMIPFCAEFEREASEADDKAAFLKEKGRPSQTEKIIWAGYKSLQLIHYFTCGADEVKCWTLRKGTNAKKGAGVIHTDLEKGFILAETMSYEDFVKHGSEQEVKKAGRYRNEGKDYIVEDGDILYFKSGLGRGKK